MSRSHPLRSQPSIPDSENRNHIIKRDNSKGYGRRESGRKVLKELMDFNSASNEKRVN